MFSGCSASCSVDDFACSPYEVDSQCVSDSSKVCDNVNDCDNGADEENCAALAPTELPMDPDSPKSLHVKGLAVNSDGRAGEVRFRFRLRMIPAGVT